MDDVGVGAGQDGVRRGAVEQGGQAELVGHGAGEAEGGGLGAAEGRHVPLERDGGRVLAVDVVAQGGPGDGAELVEGGRGDHVT